MLMKNNGVKKLASLTVIAFFLFMAFGSDEGGSSYSGGNSYNEPVYPNDNHYVDSTKYEPVIVNDTYDDMSKPTEEQPTMESGADMF